MKSTTSEKLFLPNIAICIFMDLLGMITYFFPGVAEIIDLIWAPISGYLFFKMFGGRVGLIGGVLNFIEEVLPFTDVIPSFTIAWFIRKREVDKSVALPAGSGK